jgi:hypothetical protein
VIYNKLREESKIPQISAEFWEIRWRSAYRKIIPVSVEGKHLTRSNRLNIGVRSSLYH